MKNLLLFLVLTVNIIHSQDKRAVYIIFEDQIGMSKTIYPPDKDLTLSQVRYNFECFKKSEYDGPLVFFNNLLVVEKPKFKIVDIPIIYKCKSFLKKLYANKVPVYNCDSLMQYTLGEAVDLIYKSYKIYIIDLTESKGNKLYIREVVMSNQLGE
ncbi:hypothetical protein [Flavobacterium frigoris]|uniref:Uncharacterized protein n=1 Tax=Flavobacterium frigoris (strain PS1) TaxID=1086011 RepID=H7FVJ0_FLAFP|nr:hypothetical protein [Flavobacterium frigoris]EIA07523.1 hypothetical protein HJ01_03188 [Flavobacterium frigoris PS1]